jgi:hypothetical protein
MDLLRSCYRQRINYIAGDPTKTALATWYWCRPGASIFPFANAFCSPTWDTVHPTRTTIGFDATGPRSYYNGRLLNSSTAQNYAGPASYFLEGAPAPALLPRAWDGTPVECLTAPFGLAKGGLSIPTYPVAGGKILSGTAPGPPPVPINCGTLPSVQPSVSATVTGATGFFLPWVGQTMVMTWTGLFWHGQYPILGGYLIAINADCAGSSWQANLGVNGSPQVGTAIYGFTPINFSYTFNNGAGSDITVQFG